MKYIILASIFASSAIAAPASLLARQNAQNQAGAGNQGGQAAQQAGAAQGQAAQQQAGAAQDPAAQQGQAAAGGAAAGAANGGTPTPADLATAVANWQADTSMVSNFLNTGNSILDDTAFKVAATVAFNAEVDELTHKAIIDQANGQLPNVQAANSTLATGGAFQDVVDKLQIMSQQGLVAADNIDLINQNRCVNVLPNIDAYMASTGSNSQAVRPDVCDQTGVAGGVQGTGPTQPGQTAGTPQAAFDAAAALAQGAGNGMVANAAGGNAQQAGNAQQGGDAQQAGNAQQAGAQQAGAQQAGAQQAGAQQAGAQQAGAAQAAA